MRTPDWIIPASQSEGHVSEETQAIADEIYDHDGDPELQLKLLRQAVARAREAERRTPVRYVDRRAADRAARRRQASAS